jgi:hypothetical protein
MHRHCDIAGLARPFMLIAGEHYVTRITVEPALRDLVYPSSEIVLFSPLKCIAVQVLIERMATGLCKYDGLVRQGRLQE